MTIKITTSEETRPFLIDARGKGSPAFHTLDKYDDVSLHTPVSYPRMEARETTQPFFRESANKVPNKKAELTELIEQIQDIEHKAVKAYSSGGRGRLGA
jgi:hypothetical protein